MTDIKKIVVIGPESTGKSTLSEALAKELGTVWVPEYARSYLENLGHSYEEHDLLTIAEGQLQSEDSLLLQANKILICDTDLQVIKVWSEAKYGRCHPQVMQQIAERKYDLYILTDIDMTWQPDPLREHPAPEERKYFFNIYHDIVSSSNIPWVLATGNEKERLATATKAVIALL